MRVEIESHRNHNNPTAHTHVLSCKRKGKREMVVKTYTLPLLLLEGGGMLCVGTQCFHVGEGPGGEGGEKVEGAEVRGGKSRGAIRELEGKEGDHHHHHGSGDHQHPLAEESHYLNRSPSPPTKKAGDTPSTTPSIASTPLNSSRVHVSRNGGRKTRGDLSLYNIRLVFERYTTYLRLPLSIVLKHLDEKIVIRSLANSKYYMCFV
ncbi:hypothetical protein EON65_09220 [archaeon]|nr:MAG: hypothetical protein EON65_09220 [archaeon]